ncbi:hypothetical protein DPMN_159858 [Dreissena polymorpha]|uniref:Uncharacterized protein n=1 Tax=Dreissena polymorpha TaxID=45954 RepID=A0A9D4EM72_DREPO|nr:hypothetical protein DPMN_159858 [Dreissena polymorpha]
MIATQIPADTSSYMYHDICQGRVRSMVNEVIGGSDGRDSDDEDDTKDRPSLPPNESNSHDVNSAGFHELGECDPDMLAVDSFMMGCGWARHF